MPFFKRKSVKEKDKKESSKDAPQKHAGVGNTAQLDVRPKTLLLQSYRQLLVTDSTAEGSVNRPVTASSRLCKTLQEILHDKDALPYLVQFMQSRNAAPLVKFWLDAESFQASAVTRVRSHSHLSSGQSGHGTQSTGSNNRIDSTDQNTSDANIQSTVKHKQSETDTAERARSTVVSLSNSAERSATESIQAINTHMGNGDFIASNVTSHVSNNMGTLSSQGDFSMQQPTHSISAKPAIPASDSSAHGGSSSLSLTPPHANPCDASSSYYTGLNRTQVNSNGSGSHVKGGDSGSHIENPETSQIKSAISNERNDSENCPEAVKNLTAEDQSHSGNGAALHTSLAAGSSQNTSHTPSVIRQSNPSNMNQSGAISQSDNMQLSTTNQGAAKPSLQDKLLQNIAQDAVRIFSRYLAKEATHPIGIMDDLRQDAIRAICREDGLVDPHSFVPCQQFVVQRMQNKYHSDFLQSELHCKHQVDMLTSSDVYLSDILYNDTAISYLMEFMEQEGAMPLLQCWLDLENFQQFLISRSVGDDWMEAQNDAMILYDKYFSLQATQPLGFEDKIRFEVECNICREGGPLPDCFAKPKNIVTTVLNQKYFAQFLQSEVYFKYLSDLINTVQLAQDVPNLSTRKRRGSASGSEHSAGSGVSELSTKNTLLAGGRKVSCSNVGKAISRLQPDMQIDAELFDPDLLWQRNQSGSLQVAKLDSMGRFVSEFEAEPDHEKNTFAEFGFFKRNKEKEQTQQDMALQIANMIISDITSTTQQAQEDLSTFTSEPLPK